MSMDKKKIEVIYASTRKSLQTIYKKRKVSKLLYKLSWILGGLLIVVLILYSLVQLYTGNQTYQNKNPYLLIYGFIGFSIVLSAFNYFFSKNFEKFKESESKTMATMVGYLFPKFNFTQNLQLKTKELRKSKLFPWLKIGAPVYTYGFMNTTIENVNLNISDVGIIEDDFGNKFIQLLSNIPIVNILVVFYMYIKNIFTSKNADSTLYTFRGVFCWVDFNKKLKGTTVVVANKINSKINRSLSLKFKEEEKILLEDVRFNKYFTVYGTDQVEARYALSTTLMERITALKEKFNKDVMLSFTQNQLFLTIENPNGIFSFPSGKLDSIKIIEEFVFEINSLENIVIDFNLNRKIYNN